MTTVDKVIKQCFKDTKEAFMMIVFGGLFTSILVAFGFTALIAPVTIVIMVIGVIKVILYLFVKSIYGEEATLYQLLPISTYEIIVSRVFVGMVAYVIFYLVFFGSIFWGFAGISEDTSILTEIKGLLDVIHTVGVGVFVSCLCGLLSNLFIEIMLIFTIASYWHTSILAKEKGIVRGFFGFALWVLIMITENILTAVFNLAIAGKMTAFFLAIGGLLVVSVVVGVICSNLIRKRITYKLQL